jgi:hypothetical protein
MARPRLTLVVPITCTAYVADVRSAARDAAMDFEVVAEGRATLVDGGITAFNA